MSRNNSLYFVIGALVMIVAGLAAYAYREESKPKGIEMTIGENGVHIQEN